MTPVGELAIRLKYGWIVQAPLTSGWANKPTLAGQAERPQVSANMIQNCLF